MRLQNRNNKWECADALILDLQLFAEGAGDAGAGDGGAGGTAVPVSADTGDGGGSPTQESGAESTASTPKTYSHEEAMEVARQHHMIPHNAVKERYKSTFDKAGKYDSFKSHFGAVAEKYGVSLDDPEALAHAIMTDPSIVREVAADQGVTDDVARTIVEAQAVTAMQKARMAAKVRADELSRMQAEEAAVKEAYPSFDFSTAAKNKNFKMLVDGGVPMKDAYEMSHHAVLSQAAIAAAREEARAEALAEREAVAGRPGEGAARSGGGNVSTDPSRLSREERKKLLDSYLTH